MSVIFPRHSPKRVSVVGGLEFVGPFGERLFVIPFGERLSEREMWDRGDFWGSEMARPKGSRLRGARAGLVWGGWVPAFLAFRAFAKVFFFLSIFDCFFFSFFFDLILG